VQSSTKRARRRPVLIPVAFVAAIAGSFLAVHASAQEGSAEAGRQKAAVCSACHGADGNSVNPVWPSLAGQHPVYTARQLEAYREGERTAPEMLGFAQTLSEQDRLDIAAYFSTQAIAPKGADPALVERGQRIYRGGVPERGVAACIACHGPGGNGNPLAGFPRISHQHATYLAATLRDYRSGERQSDASLNQMMRNVAELLLDDEIEALASYIQGLN
jgi:cytochrome c553